jgi:hypothetical protein
VLLRALTSEQVWENDQRQMGQMVIAGMDGARAKALEEDAP